MDIIELRAMGLLSDKHIGRILLFNPSAELCSGLVKIGAVCECADFYTAERISAGEDILEGEFICIMTGNVLDLISDKVRFFSVLRQHLSSEGALTAMSSCGDCEELTALLKQAGFHDVCFDKVSGKCLLFRAQIPYQKTILLQQQLTTEVRHTLLYLLRRVETGIDTERNIQALWALCEKEKISADYLLPFIENTMIKPQRVLRLLAGTAGE